MHVPDRVIRPQPTEFKAQTPLPTQHGPFTMCVFHQHTEQGLREHVAMVYGDVQGVEGTLARVHSECMTSEVFGSLKCDCREQLAYALDAVAREGRGVVLYLRQEGRGIGLTNKVHAYEQQAHGLDTVDANRALGLPDDARTYESARDMLAHLQVPSVRLLTNNPDKVRKLTELGVDVRERVPVWIEPNRYSLGYLETKRARMDHLLPANLELPKPATG